MVNSAQTGQNLQDYHLQSGVKANTQTLAGTKTLVDGDPQLQFLDPGGASRDVNLPAEGDNNTPYYIINTADAAENLVVKSDAPATIITIGQNEIGTVFSDGTAWRGFVGVL